MKKYRIVQSGHFKKDLKLAIKYGYDIALLEHVVNTIATDAMLPQKHKDHSLSENFKDCRECHITPDWLRIYEMENDELILYSIRTGTHSALF